MRMRGRLFQQRQRPAVADDLFLLSIAGVQKFDTVLVAVATTYYALNDQLRAENKDKGDGDCFSDVEVATEEERQAADADVVGGARKVDLLTLPSDRNLDAC